MVSRNLRQAYLQGVDLTQIPRDHDYFLFFNIFFSMTDFRAHCKVDSITYSKTDSKTDKRHQVVLSSW